MPIVPLTGWIRCRKGNVFMNWLLKFMYGRHGPDQFSFWLFILFLVLDLIGSFQAGAAKAIFALLAIAALVYSLFRIFSRQNEKRWAENQKFLAATQPLSRWVQQQKGRWSSRKIYHYFRCPKCGATLRVPRGRGKICIKCPVCQHEFIKKA